jgi:hypothetical protein
MWKSFDKRLAGFLLEEASLEAVFLRLTEQAAQNAPRSGRKAGTPSAQDSEFDGEYELIDENTED